MLDPETWPETPEAAEALVALVLADILSHDRFAREAMLADFMTAAWPSPRGSRQ